MKLSPSSNQLHSSLLRLLHPNLVPERGANAALHHQRLQFAIRVMNTFRHCVSWSISSFRPSLAIIRKARRAADSPPYARSTNASACAKLAASTCPFSLGPGSARPTQASHRLLQILDSISSSSLSTASGRTASPRSSAAWNSPSASNIFTSWASGRSIEENRCKLDAKAVVRRTIESADKGLPAERKIWDLAVRRESV